MIPFYSFKEIHVSVADRLIRAAEQVIRSGNYVFGTEEFEKEFAAWTGAQHCVAVSNGTSAIHLALLALGIGPGDEVITVSHTFRATAAAIRYVGATPVYVDVDPKTYVMDASKIESKITPRTRAILPVHLYGNAVDMPAVLAIAQQHQLRVIEDCSQAHGTTIYGRHVGTFGDIGTFSFYPGKGLGALGDAGCVVTNSAELADIMSRTRSWDESDTGYNYRMANIQAEFLRVKLQQFGQVLIKKRKIAEAYQQAFGTVAVAPGVAHSWHVYPIMVQDRPAFLAAMSGLVDVKMHYHKAVHQWPAYQQSVDLPVTEYIVQHQVSLPIYPGVDHAGVIAAVLSNRSNLL